MFVDLVQVYEETFLESPKKSSEGVMVHHNTSAKYFLRTVSVNMDKVLFIREDAVMRHNMLQNNLPSELNPEQSFTKVFISADARGSSSSISVVGSREAILEKFKQAKCS
jgi:hypothetical protein